MRPNNSQDKLATALVFHAWCYIRNRTTTWRAERRTTDSKLVPVRTRTGLDVAASTSSSDLTCACTADHTANSHHRARHDKTVLSVSRPLRWCELDSRDNSRLSPTENLKPEHVQSNCPIHTGRPDTTQTFLLRPCPTVGCWNTQRIGVAQRVLDVCKWPTTGNGAWTFFWLCRAYISWFYLLFFPHGQFSVYFVALLFSSAWIVSVCDCCECMGLNKMKWNVQTYKKLTNRKPDCQRCTPRKGQFTSPS